ncbi:hypothetical protein K443DRAFT_113749 [Laccaria amethystina LaAM-08-1]|uniref:Uncharacterized protein n=1 Tax=Laccaria amethystina LaAM-08-1 TaxID=1095629 RepID=A0A0C9WI53_9AGAR|nr:hypothetical protein K443DRAFT_113749 [Laccaria amethystina LaAM-08-1]
MPRCVTSLHFFNHHNHNLTQRQPQHDTSTPNANDHPQLARHHDQPKTKSPTHKRQQTPSKTDHHHPPRFTNDSQHPQTDTGDNEPM